MNIFRGDLSDISAKSATLAVTYAWTPASDVLHKHWRRRIAFKKGWLPTAVPVLVDIMVTSPRKLIIFIERKNMFRVKVSQKCFV